MAKRRKSRAISHRRMKRSRSGRGRVHGILPVAAGLGVVGIVTSVSFANPTASATQSPLAYLMAGNVQGAFNALTSNIGNPSFIATIIPALILLWAFSKLHSKLGSATRISRHFSAL